MFSCAFLVSFLLVFFLILVLNSDGNAAADHWNALHVYTTACQELLKNILVL